MDKILCIFHANCLDGLCAASILHNRFPVDSIEMMPMEYTDDVPDLKGRTVYILDFSWPPEVLLPAIATAKEVILIDHHEKAMMKWQNYLANPQFRQSNFTIKYDKTRSGAGNVWDYFYPSEPMPLLYQYAQDYDLWNFHIPKSREVCTAIMGRGIVRDMDFDALLTLANYFKCCDIRGIPRLEVEGAAIVKNNDVVLSNIIKRNMRMIDLQGYTVPCVNVPYEMISRAGEILAQEHPFAVLYEDWGSHGKRKYSLRSKKGGVDVSNIAAVYGGNGHENAAGFFMPLPENT